ncbi:MAG: tetratricopeptide repeat protein [Terracidiphilus sp.]
MRRQLKWSIVSGIWLIIATTAGIGQVASTNDNRRSTAIALEEQGRVSQAEAAWQQIAKTDPNDAEAYAHLGLLQAREEHYKEAIPLYRRALALNPKMPGLRMNLGLAYFKGGDLHSAVTTFEQLLGATPRSSPEALRLTTLIGLANYGLGEYADAVPHLKAATAADPENLPFRMMLVRACLRSKQYQCVLDVCREILTLNAESAEADMLAGEAYDEMKNEAGAIAEFQAAIKSDPKASDVHFGYGYLLWRQMKFDEAETEFKSELANNPDHPYALTYLGDTEIHLNHSNEAVTYLEHAIQIQPSIALAHLDLGIAYQGQGHIDDALRELKGAEKLSPDDPMVHWHLGRLYQSLGQKVEAKTELERTQNLQEKKNESLREQMNQIEPKSAGQNADLGTK